MSNFLVNTAIHGMLDDLATRLDQASLHTAYSASGANEVTGGSYARQSITWNAASGATLNSSNAPAFSVPSGNTIRFVGFWSTAESPDAFMGMLPNQQAADFTPRRYIVNTSGNRIECPAHGLVADDGVVWIGGTPPGGITEGTIYYVGNVTTDDFQIQTTKSASPFSAVGLSTQGDEDVFFWQVREETFSADGTFNLTDADFDFLGT